MRYHVEPRRQHRDRKRSWYSRISLPSDENEEIPFSLELLYPDTWARSPWGSIQKALKVIERQGDATRVIVEVPGSELAST